jgi:hypothetical protein
MFKDLFELSQKEKKGLMFYLNGQTVGGLVTKIISDDLIEVRNREYDQILIRVASIDAVAISGGSARPA